MGSWNAADPRDEEFSADARGLIVTIEHLELLVWMRDLYARWDEAIRVEIRKVPKKKKGKKKAS